MTVAILFIAGAEEQVEHDEVDDVGERVTFSAIMLSGGELSAQVHSSHWTATE